MRRRRYFFFCLFCLFSLLVRIWVACFGRIAFLFLLCAVPVSEADNNGDPYALPDYGFYYMANDDFNGITSANAVAWKASSSGLTFDGSDLALSGGTLMARLPMRSSDHHVNAAIVQVCAGVVTLSAERVGPSSFQRFRVK